MVEDLARIRFLTRNLEALQGLRDVVGGLCIMAIGILWGPDPYLGVPFPSAEDWAAPTSARLVAGAGVVIAWLALHQRVKRFYARRFGQVKQPADPGPTDAPTRAIYWFRTAWVIGLGADWWWLIAPGALGTLMLYPLKWRRDGGFLPTELVLWFLVPLLTLALPQQDPVTALIDANFATLLVVVGALGVVVGILNHFILVRLLNAGGRGSDD